MAKLTGALMSLGARGTLAKTITFGSWRGIPYARQHVVPTDRKTVSQLAIRARFKWLEDAWKVSPPLLRESWEAAAKGAKYVGRNLWVGRNVTALKGDSDTADLIFGPGANGGLPCTSVSITPGSGELTVDATNPAAPTDWTLDSLQVIALSDQDPGADYVNTWSSGEDDTTQTQVVLTGLTASTLYRVGAVLKWTKADGSTAYGAAVAASGTPT
jgi:hypothetical protein